MTEYNYVIGRASYGGDFVFDIDRVVIYKKGTPAPNMATGLDVVIDKGEFETTREMQSLKTIIIDELHSSGSWNQDYMDAEIPGQAFLSEKAQRVKRMLNPEFLDNYQIQPEVLF